VASRLLPEGTARCRREDEADLVLEGFLVFEDPPRASSQPALAAMRQAGVAVKVLTGDHVRVAQHVCEALGLPRHPVLTGAQMEAMTPEQLRQTVDETVVFAQLDPFHKERIVQALRANGRRVGFLGDGINDAPALRASDVGISVHAAVDVARESADIVLLEKSLMVLVQGVLEGRRTVVKLRKYVHMTVSSNFGNALSILMASVVLPFLPMQPVHLLLQNFLYDLTQGALPFDAVDEAELARPPADRPGELLRFMLWFGPLSSAFDLLVFGVLWFGFGASGVATQTLFQSGWFVFGLLSQTLVVHSLRTARIPWLQSRAAPPVLLGSAAVLACAVWLVHGPLAEHLQLEPLPASFWGFALGLLGVYLLAVHGLKRAFIRRHGWP
jgi:Mg2+-importing ATPase